MTIRTYPSMGEATGDALASNAKAAARAAYEEGYLRDEEVSYMDIDVRAQAEKAKKQIAKALNDLEELGLDPEGSLGFNDGTCVMSTYNCEAAASQWNVEE